MTTTTDRDQPHAQGQFHAVRFYEDGQSHARVVAGFIAEGLVAGDAAIIVATPQHRHRILRAASAMSIDIERLMACGDLVALDAQAALEGIMVRGMPAMKPFEDAILPLVDKASGGRAERSVRMYGEMADVLWNLGREDAAIGLETLGNHLAAMRKVSIFCGYSLANLYAETSFKRICGEHTHAVSAEGVATPIGPGGVI